jgi:hypothetical protein
LRELKLGEGRKIEENLGRRRGGEKSSNPSHFSSSNLHIIRYLYLIFIDLFR